MISPTMIHKKIQVNFPLTKESKVKAENKSEIDLFGNPHNIS
jgi:hypothetical protein